MPELDGQQPEAPASQPAQQAFDPEAFKASLLAEWENKTNERIAGVQSSFQKLLNEREAEIRELKTANLSEDEREQLAEQEAQAYIDNLEFQVWLANEANKKFSKAAPHIQKLAELDGDVTAFAEYLEAALSPALEPEPEPVVSDVDPNNAPRTPVAAGPDSYIGPDGQVMTPELRKQILAGFGNMSLAEIRSKG